MKDRPQNPWLFGACVVGIVFLTIELAGTLFGWFVGIRFMHGRIDGLDGAMFFAIISLYASVPASLLAGVIGVIVAWKR